MPATTDKLFRFASLAEYSFKQRLSIKAADLAFYTLIRLLGATVRFETDGIERFDEIAAAGRTPIMAFWHDRIFLTTYYFRNRGIVVLTSQSFDGEYIARFIQRFGYGAIRGSSTRGGAKGLVEMIRALRHGHAMGFTVDGPRGPRYSAKPGPVVLAKKTGDPILPFLVETQKYWTINSWDRLQIPKPFTRARVMIGEPIYVPGDIDDAGREARLAELQSSLNTLVEQGRLWRGKS